MPASKPSIRDLLMASGHTDFESSMVNSATDVQAVVDTMSNIVTGALFVFSDGTNAHIWYDSNPSTAGGAVVLATLTGIELSELGQFSAAHFYLGAV